jgi:hypothetical protein
MESLFLRCLYNSNRYGILLIGSKRKSLKYSEEKHNPFYIDMNKERCMLNNDLMTLLVVGAVIFIGKLTIVGLQRFSGEK